jgi:hypothetical protein
MLLPLTTDQTAQIEPHLRHDAVLLARIERMAFDGSNAATAGALMLVFTSIPSARLASVRAAISGEQAKPKRKAKPQTL